MQPILILLHEFRKINTPMSHSPHQRIVGGDRVNKTNWTSILTVTQRAPGNYSSDIRCQLRCQWTLCERTCQRTSIECPTEWAAGCGNGPAEFSSFFFCLFNWIASHGESITFLRTNVNWNRPKIVYESIERDLFDILRNRFIIFASSFACEFASATCVCVCVSLLPDAFNDFSACGTANCGAGKSKKTASTRPFRSSLNPLAHTSRW